MDTNDATDSDSCQGDNLITNHPERSPERPTDRSEWVSADDMFAIDLPPITERVDDYERDDDDDDDGGDVAVDPDAEREKWRGRISSSGQKYDPERHRWPAEETKTGRWRLLPKAERRKRKVARNGEPVATETSAYTREAENYALLYAQMHPVLLGPDAGLDNPADIIALRDSIQRYMEINGYSEISPGYGVALAAANYTFGVVRRPTVNERVAAWMRKIRGTIKRKRKQRGDNAHDDRRHNNVGQNQSGKTPARKSYSPVDYL